MFKLSKIIIISFAFALVSSLLCGCKGETVPEVDDPPTPNPVELPAGVIPLEEPITLCTTNECFYTVTKSATGNDKIGELAEKLVKAPTTLGMSRTKFRFSTDSAISRGSELLIGNTNRPETKAALDSIGLDDYVIEHRGNHIVVAAHTASRLAEAVDFLCDNLLKVVENEEGKKTLLYLGDYTYVSEERSFLFGGNNQLSGYTIVYKESSEELTNAANLLKNAIKNTYGIDLPIADDSVGEVEKEIVLGNVNRSISKQYFDVEGAAFELESVLAVSGQKLLIGNFSDKMTKVAVNNFCTDYMNSNFSNTLRIPTGQVIKSDTYRFTECIERTDGSNLRVMSFNLLYGYGSNPVLVEGRDSIVMSAINAYDPDGMGLQEVCWNWYDKLDILFGERYAIADKLNFEGETNFSPIAYNTERIRLIESGVEPLFGTRTKLRVISWAYFERKSDGARFVVLNTHWNLNSDPEGRTQQANEMAQFANNIQDKYDCPIISTGDYNTYVYDEQFGIYSEGASLKDARESAKTVNRACRTTHKVFNNTSMAEAPAIDHILVSTEVEVLFYNVIVGEHIINGSDHFPIYADIKLN